MNKLPKYVCKGNEKNHNNQEICRQDEKKDAKHSPQEHLTSFLGLILTDKLLYPLFFRQLADEERVVVFCHYIAVKTLDDDSLFL